MSTKEIKKAIKRWTFVYMILILAMVVELSLLIAGSNTVAITMILLVTFIMLALSGIVLDVYRTMVASKKG